MDGRHLEPGFRMHQGHGGLRSLLRGTPRPAGPGGARDRKRGVEGKRVEFGGGRIIKKKKKKIHERGHKSKVEDDKVHNCELEVQLVDPAVTFPRLFQLANAGCVWVPSAYHERLVFSDR